MSTPGQSDPDSLPTRTFGPGPDDAPTSSGCPPGSPGSAPAADPGPAARFRPVRFHKEGGMGRVHVALDAELNRHVAFKEILPDLAGLPAVVDHFLFEAEVTGRLEHPGVVPVYGLGRCPDGRPYYAMRFIDGQSLREAIRGFHAAAGPDRAAGLRRLLTRFVAVCQTVGYAHSRGVIHRDLKPHNVMLGPFGETLLVDWGLAKRIRNPDPGPRGESAESPIAESLSARAADSNAALRIGPSGYEATRTATGTRVGSPGYWSPEQAAGMTDRHDERTDVYGLGAVLYQILTGNAPHPSGEHEPEPPSPKAASPWVDDALDAICRKAMATRRRDRYPTALALAEEIDRWLADQPVAAQRSAVAALSRRADESPADHALAEQLARQRANLGLMLSGMGRDRDAVAELEAAATIFDRLSAADPNRPRYRAEQANTFLALVQPLTNLGRSADAAAREQAATDIYSGLIAAHPEEYRANLATIMVTHAGGAVAAPAPAPEAPTGPSAERTHDGEVSLGPPATALPGTVHVEPPAPARPAVAEPELPQGYTVVRVLGQGAFGQILLARDNALNRLVAIKDFRPDLSDTARVRVVREMQVTARLIHPNIIRVYTYGIHAGTRRPFLVMEYIPGKTLKEEVEAFAGGTYAKENPAFARMIAAVAQACDGIQFAHTQGVLHRDPKPSNIMIGEDGGRAVVLDWGLAKILDAAEPKPADLAEGPRVSITFTGPAPTVRPVPANDPDLTQEGAVLGTPAYMAPEQARGGGPNPRSDIYTLGAGLFEVLTGQPPHTGADLNSVLQQLLFGQLRRPRDLNPALPVELEAICAVAMARNPDDRYPTAAAMAEDLRAWLAGKPLAVRHRGRLRKLWDQFAVRG